MFRSLNPEFLIYKKGLALNARMNGEAQGFRFIFELADEAAYSGRTFPADDLRQESGTVAELKRLELP